MKRLVSFAVAPITLVIAIIIAISAQAVSLAPSASEIDHSVSVALNRLYSHDEEARALGAKDQAGSFATL
jgi:hypothetical protein